MATAAGQRQEVSSRDLLADLRSGRGFQAEEVLDAKARRCARWFLEHDLDAAVVGVSGGIDSAVTLGVLDRIRRLPGSPLRRLVACVVPVEGEGATGQDAAARRAHLVVERFDVETWDLPLGEVHAALLGVLEKGSGIGADAWAAGQLVAVERTPVLYGAVALLRTAGWRGVVVGTTNRDEGAYLGFFGKASDGAVDLQLLSDLHKSEVRALAELLDVPAEVQAAEPSGDVWDGRTDEEMIGADYDGVELVLRLRELGRDPLLTARQLVDGTRVCAAAEAVDRLHAENAHKYRVGSPAVHLDVLPRGVPGGWSDETLAPRSEQPPAEPVPGRWDPPTIELGPAAHWPRIEWREQFTVGRSVLSESDCRTLLDALADAPSSTVGVSGLVDSYGSGSVRSTAFSPELAAQLWARLAPLVPASLNCGPFDPTDAFASGERAGHRTWRVVGLSPLLRFMRYSPGGQHFGHYDAGFDYGDGRRTLLSAVLFVAADGAGGALRFLDDGQQDLPVERRDHRDWTGPAAESQVIDVVQPEPGSAVVFPHRRCHDVAVWHGPGDRVIVRADVVYERIPDGREPT